MLRAAGNTSFSIPVLGRAELEVIPFRVSGRLVTTAQFPWYHYPPVTIVSEKWLLLPGTEPRLSGLYYDVPNVGAISEEHLLVQVDVVGNLFRSHLF